MRVHPFRPLYQGTLTITAGTSNTATALPSKCTRYVVYNAGTAVVFVEFGDSNITAAVASGYPIGPGMKETLSVHGGAAIPTYIATISGSASQTVYVSAGSGE